MNHRSPRCRHHQGRPFVPTLPAPCHKGRGGGVASSRLLGSSPNRCLPKQAPLPTTHRCVLSTRDNNQPFTCHAPIGLDHPNSAIIIFINYAVTMHVATNSIAGCLPALPSLPFPAHDLVSPSPSFRPSGFYLLDCRLCVLARALSGSRCRDEASCRFFYAFCDECVAVCVWVGG